ncbi:MAG: glycosyltransferase, partial [Atribacterota bacterium]
MFDQGTIFTHFERVHIFAIVLAGIAFFNLLTIQKPTRRGITSEKPLVSILIPARNEERTITRCLQSILAQDYPRFEVLVWDDCSTDKTREILYTIQDRRFRWIAGSEPPPGWLGKS